MITDVVLWDSHPLTLGATPQQVWIDGIPQLATPYTITKPSAFQQVPKVPNFDDEVKQTLEYDGLPPLEPKKALVLVTTATRIYQFVGTPDRRSEEGGRVFSALFGSYRDTAPSEFSGFYCNTFRS